MQYDSEVTCILDDRTDDLMIEFLIGIVLLRQFLRWLDSPRRRF